MTNMKRTTKRQLVERAKPALVEQRSRKDKLMSAFNLRADVALKLANDDKLFAYFMSAQNLIVMKAKQDMMKFIERQTIQLAQDITNE